MFKEIKDPDDDHDDDDTMMTMTMVKHGETLSIIIYHVWSIL